MHTHGEDELERARRLMDGKDANLVELGLAADSLVRAGWFVVGVVVCIGLTLVLL